MNANERELHSLIRVIRVIRGLGSEKWGDPSSSSSLASVVVWGPNRLVRLAAPSWGLVQDSFAFIRVHSRLKFRAASGAT